MKTYRHQGNLLQNSRIIERRPSRRRGVVVLYVAFGLSAFLGVTALVVDMGNLYNRRVQAQRAADAAALAGGLEMAMNKGTITTKRDEALKKAVLYAKENGYDKDDAGRKATVTAYPVDDNGQQTSSATPSRYMAHVERTEQLYFYPAVAALVGKVGESDRARQVGATAIAEYAVGTSTVDMNINGGGKYGMSDGVSNPSIFGPYAWHYNGDPYSTKYMSDGSLNPQYEDDGEGGAGKNGYSYTLSIPNNYKDINGTSKVSLELFDPECNNGGPAYAMDEIRERNPAAGSGPEPTTTVYTLTDPQGKLVASATYTDDLSTNAKWVTPDGFEFDFEAINADGTSHGTGLYTLNVKSIEGSSENGFNLRAGPPHDPALTDQQWSDQFGQNGTSITAKGRLPMNFTNTGVVTVTLGRVPTNAAGGTLFIDKFDTDVGSKSIVYSCDSFSIPSDQAKGVLTDNDKWGPIDKIDIPDNYTEGTWYATYTAGAGDTSVWKMNYSREKSEPGPGPVIIRLVQ